MRFITYTLLLVLISSFVRPVFAGGETQFKEGLKAYHAHNYRAASKHFSESLESGNGSPEVYIYLAHSYAASGEKTKALKKYHQIVKIFKDLPAEKVALHALRRLDPHRTFRDLDEAKIAGNTKKLSLVNRITVLPPTISGHPPVSPDTVGTIRSVVSQLPKYAYDILDRNGVNIYIAPNMSDKWPDALTGSKPGAEHMTMSQERARTYDTEIYFFERPTKTGSKDLDAPFTQEEFKREAFYQLSHALDFCLKITDDKKLRSEFDSDKRIISEENKKKLTYYLQPDYKGLGEVVACTLEKYYSRVFENKPVAEHFPRSWRWIERRMEEERNKRPEAKSADTPTVALKEQPAEPLRYATRSSKALKQKLKSSIAAASMPTTGTNTSDDPLTKPEDPPDPSDLLPEEDHVHFFKDRHGKPMVNGLLNGRPLRMLIDTGAYRTVVGKRNLDMLNIPVPKEKPTRFSYGAGGKVYYWTMPFEFVVGKTKRKMNVCVIEDEDFICLGQSFLRGLSYRFDNLKNEIYITKSGERTKTLLAQDAIEIPYRMVNGNMIIVLKVEGKNIETNFDTGAHGFLLGYDQAEKQGILEKKNYTRARMKGLGGKTADTLSCVLDNIELGPMKWTNVPALLFGGYSVIGQDFFGNRHFVIDHENRVIRFSRR